MINKQLENAILANNPKEVSSILKKEKLNISYFKEEFLLAIKTNHLECAEKFLLNGMPVINDYANSNEIVEYSFMNKMAFIGNIEAMKLLMKYGADVHETSFMNHKSLHCAAMNKKFEAMDFLIANGAEINSIDGRGTLFQIFITGNHMDGVDYLLDKGADVNLLNRDGLSPLFIALQSRNGSVINKLIDHGADGHFVLDKAIERKNKSVAYDLLKYIDQFEKGKNFYTSLLLLEILNPSVDKLEYLIQNGADVKIKDKNGETLIMKAAKKGRIAVINRLMQCGADINEVDQKGNNVFYYAVKSKSVTPDFLCYLANTDLTISQCFYDKDGISRPMVNASKEQNIKDCINVILESKNLLKNIKIDSHSRSNPSLNF